MRVCITLLFSKPNCQNLFKWFEMTFVLQYLYMFIKNCRLMILISEYIFIAVLIFVLTSVYWPPFIFSLHIFTQRIKFLLLNEIKLLAGWFTVVMQEQLYMCSCDFSSGFNWICNNFLRLSKSVQRNIFGYDEPTLIFLKTRKQNCSIVNRTQFRKLFLHLKEFAWIIWILIEFEL